MYLHPTHPETQCLLFSRQSNSSTTFSCLLRCYFLSSISSSNLGDCSTVSTSLPSSCSSFLPFSRFFSSVFPFKSVFLHWVSLRSFLLLHLEFIDKDIELFHEERRLLPRLFLRYQSLFGSFALEISRIESSAVSLSPSVSTHLVLISSSSFRLLHHSP